MPTTNSNDVVMTVPEVAEYLRVSKSKVYELAQTEKIPAKKVGGQWRFSRSELEEWLRAPEGSSSDNQKEKQL